MDDILVLKSQNNLTQVQKTDLSSTVNTYLKNFLSHNTRMAYTTDFFDFAAFLEINGFNLAGPHQITKDHIIDYRDSIINHYAPNTIHRKLSSLSSLFNELVQSKIMDENPVIGIQRPKARAIRAKTGLSDEEINKICNFYDGKTIQSLQNKALLTFLSYTGCRISEVISVRLTDIKTENDIKIVIIKGKGSKIRKIPLHPKLWAVLKEQIRRREKVEDDYIFTAIMITFYTGSLRGK